MSLQQVFFGSIKKKIFSGFSVTLIFILILFLTTYQINQEVSRHTIQISAVERPLTLSVERIIAHDSELTGFLQYAIIHAQQKETELMEEEIANYETTSNELSRLISTTIPTLIGKSERDETTKRQTIQYIYTIDTVNRQLLEIEMRALEELKQNNPEGAQQIIISKEYQQLKQKYQETYNAWIEIEKTTEKQHEQKIIELTNILSILTIFLGAIIIATGISVAFITSYIIVPPLTQLSKSTEKISKGDYSARVNIRTGDELEQLGDLFNKTAETLGNIDEERKVLDKSKIRFINIVSHEMRSPMTPMKAQLQMLLQSYFGKLSKQQQESLSVILNNAERLDKLLADFLEVARIESGRLKFTYKPTDPKQVIEETVTLLKGFMAEKNIKIETEIDKLPIIETDPDRLSQVLRNLTDNAIKFSKEKGTVTIRAKANKEQLTFSVTDQGIGISKENQKKLFQPFYQVEQEATREHLGTGLGLSVCRGIIQSQGGNIWVESSLGKGSTFIFTLPRKPPKNTKGITLMFSSTEDAEQKIKKLFTQHLGPLGAHEFEELRERGVNKNNVYNYIKELHEQHIIDKKTAQRFKADINGILIT